MQRSVWQMLCRRPPYTVISHAELLLAVQALSVFGGSNANSVALAAGAPGVVGGDAHSGAYANVSCP